MHVFVFLILCAAQCYVRSESHTENIETLMDNVVVLKVHYGVPSRVYVPLTCGEDNQIQPVFWKRNGEELSPRLEGNQVSVLVEEMNGGNYSCHLSSNGQYVNHTVIMVQLEENRTVILEEKSTEDGYIHCSALNYSGPFHCSWTRRRTRANAAVLLIKAHRNSVVIPCELNADGSGVQCQNNNCPTEEEQHRISLTVYLYSHSRLEKYEKTFYLREIVRPGRLPNLHLTEGRAFSWSYPETWQEPCSFFGLQFQVKVVHHGQPCNSEEHIVQNIIQENTYEVGVKTKKYVFCVRAQDKHTGGPWGHWNHCTVNKGIVSC
ncbi:interleukin-12 subunit beta [Sphaeramia orbicularis]|uniref:Interleukin-12 subunit beta n=1 Tax=Sphaeramia orbicularis TaxID=375764 RepID=A0A673A2N5_9TELE|nr:interleukin-12 subunit beta-like [Sphaeramia orbicularis]